MSSREQAQWEALLSSRCPVYINEDSARGQAGKSKTQDGAPQEAGTRHQALLKAQTGRGSSHTAARSVSGQTYACPKEKEDKG